MTQAFQADIPRNDSLSPVPEPFSERLARARALLDRATPAPPRELRLDWQGMRLDVAWSTAPDGYAELRIAGCIGIVPFTAENSAARRAALALLARPGGDPADRIRRDTRGAVWLDSRTLFPPPASEAELVAAVAVVLMSLESRLLALRAELLPARSGLAAAAA